MKLNPDRQIVNSVLEGLAANLLLYGARYCPCAVNRTNDTVCPCKNMRELNECHCQLYVE